MEIVALLIVIIILGALAGGNSFGGTVRKGCGCLAAIVVVLLVLALVTGVLSAEAGVVH
jgi:hypothetical protein